MPIWLFQEGAQLMVLWARFLDGGQECFGVVDGEQVIAHSGEMFGESAAVGTRRSVAEVRLLTPCEPRLMIGLAHNFRALVAKAGQSEPEVPLYFIKAPGSILPPQGHIRRPTGFDGRVIFEGELGVVIGKRCRNLYQSAAEEAIFGYTCVNDVTIPEWIASPANFPQWTRAKSCDTFGPFGPVIATGLDWRKLVIRTVVDGRERQNYPADDMILSPALIVSLLSQELTLMPGDLIACGTSLGAAPMRSGQTVQINIDGIGTLSNVFEADREL